MYKELLKEKYGVKVLSALEPVSDDEGGEFYEMFLEWNAEKYSKRLSKRVRDGLDTSVENGTFCGGNLLYGYALHKEPVPGKASKQLKTIVIDEEQAAVVRYVFEEYDKGVTKKEIAAALNTKGCRYKGKLFTGKSFDKWIVNPKYSGEFIFGGRVCNNMYPAIVDKELFARVQKRLSNNRYFAGGVATAREPYLLTGKAKCGHCETDMVSDGGTSKKGKKHYYYACKNRKIRLCRKRREDKGELELYATVSTTDFLSEPANAELAVNDTIAYYEKKTGAESLRSIETKISKTRQEVEELVDAFVKAKSELLQTTIEKKMLEYETLLKDLMAQQAQLELERGYAISKQDLLAFIAELLKGDPNDKEHQRKIIDNLVYKIYVYDDYKVIYLKLNGGRGIEVDNVTLAETNEAVSEFMNIQTQFPPSRPVGIAFEHRGNTLYLCKRCRGVRGKVKEKGNSGKTELSFFIVITVAGQFWTGDGP